MSSRWTKHHVSCFNLKRDGLLFVARLYGTSHSRGYGPLKGKTICLGISVSRNEAASQLTTDRSVRCRVFPWGRRSPLRSKELSNYPAGSRTAVALSKLHKFDLSVCAPRRRSLCALLPSLGVVDKCGDRKPATPGLS